MKKTLDKLQYIQLYEILGCFLFIICIPISFIFKLYFKITKKKIWLISENYDTARDNGYHFYKYLKENKIEGIESYYVIDKKCDDYARVKDLGNIIQYRSLKHWIFYMASDKVVSSIKNCSPDHPLFSVLLLKFNLYKKVVFLQHGILLNEFPMFYYKNSKFRLFICGAKDEFENLKKFYRYNDSNAAYTGLARFDNLIEFKVNQNEILIIPTWRRWLGREKNLLGKEEDFSKSEYYKRWNSLINNDKFIKFIEGKNLIVKFYPHKGMSQFLNEFESKSNNIIVLDNKKQNIQDLLKESALMITDYSSICCDFAFMKKPIIFYQFDQKEFYEKHAKKGYFDFENDGFGKVVQNEHDLIEKIIYYIDNNYKVEEKYRNKMDSFFELHDKNNCERIYKRILEIR